MNEPSVLKVLLLDDNPGDRRFVQSALEQFSSPKLRVNEADSLEAALACLAEGGIGLILVDATFGDQGRDAVTRLRKKAGSAPVVVLTHQKDEALLLSCLERGAHALAQKNGNGENLLLEIRRALARATAPAGPNVVDHLADHAPALLWVSDAEGRWTFTNPSWLKFTGRTSAQALADRWKEGLHPDDLPQADRLFVQAAEAKSGLKREYRLKNHAGEYRWIMDEASPFLNERGELAGYIGTCTDITEHVKLEEALTHSEERFRLAAQCASDFIYEWDIPSGNVTWYGQVDENLGYAPGEFPRTVEAWEGVIHPEDRHQVMEAVSRHLATGGRFYEKYRVVRKDGAVLYWTDHGGAVLNAEGKPVKWVGAASDISDGMRAKESLQASEKLWHTLFEAANDIMLLLDERHEILAANRRAVEAYGHREEELVGRKFSALRADAASRDGDAPFDAALDGTVFEAMHRRKDGKTFPVEASLRPFTVNGRTQFVLVARDITERRQVEEDREQLLARERAAHAEAEAAQWRFAFLAEASTLLTSSLDYATTLERVARLAVPYVADWCLIHIPDGERLKPLAVAHVNPAKVEVIKELENRFPSRADMPHWAGKVIRTGTSEIYATIPDLIIAAVAHNRDHQNAIQALHLKSAMVVPLTARGKTLGAITFLSAESQRVYTAQDLAFAEDLANRAALAVDNARLYRDAQEAVRTRDHFISLASHELRTPITVILGYTQLLLRGMDPARANHQPMDPAHVQNQLKNIERSTHRLNKLIEEFLDVTRLQKNGLKIQPERMNLSELLTSVVDSVRVREQANPSAPHFQWDIKVPTEGPVWGLWDKSRLEQVLLNLLDNAVKYSPAGGKIVVSLSLEDERPGGGNRQAHIAVRDEGIGVPAEERGKIFHTFFRATNLTGRNVKGMGLGLAVCKGIVDMHGGRIWTDSDGQERGSAFHVVLPNAALSETIPALQSNFQTN